MVSKSRQLSPESAAGYRTLALIITSVAVFLIAFMIPAMNVALPKIGEEFKADAILLGWTVTAYVVAISVCSIPFGRVADILGIKKLFGLGLIIYAFSAVMILFSNSTIMVIIIRAIQGLGAALVLVTSLAMVTAIFPKSERGRALGTSLACIFVGSSAGPFLGGVLTEHFGWRSIFYINIPVGFILAFLLFWKIKGEWAESRGEKFDYSGSIIFGIALAAFMYGFSELPEIRGGILVLVGILGLIGFYKWEGRVKSPVLDVAVFRGNRLFVFANLATLINFAAVAAVTYLMSLYLQYIQGFTPQMAGLILIAQPVVQALLSPFTGMLSEKFEPRIMATVGMTLTCLGLISFALLPDRTSLAQIIITLIILGLGFAFFLSPNTNSIMSSVVPKFYGVASATMSTMISIGNTFSMAITMIIMALVIGRVEVTPEYYPAFLTSTKIAFGVFAAVSFIGIFVSFFRGKAPKVS